jgi:hypothetical protein
MLVIIKIRMHERDNSQKKEDDSKNYGEAFHNANTNIIGPLVTADVFEPTLRRIGEGEAWTSKAERGKGTTRGRRQR